MRLTGYAKRSLVLLGDGSSIVLAFAAAFLLRFDFRLDEHLQQLLLRTIPCALIGFLLPAYFAGLYRGIWRYASFPDLVRILKTVGAGSILASALILFTNHEEYPRSVLIMGSVCSFLGICGVRFMVRFAKDHFEDSAAPEWGRTTLIVGAGDLGESVLRQLRQTGRKSHRIIGFIDDDRAKWNLRIHGVPVLGGVRSLPEILANGRIEEIIVAISTVRGTVLRAVMDALTKVEARPEIRIAPTINETLQQPGSKVVLREIRPADLLNREEVRLDESRIARFIAGRTVLVTGAGGTIGKELCRQVLRYGPEKLVLVESHANSLFQAELELLERKPQAELVPVLGSILDRAFLERVFRSHRPQIVLHAAAHKHQPQLEREDNYPEAVKTNLLGTYSAAELADAYGAQAFLLISTDKAVSPSGMMGATKRAAEMVVRAFAARSKTKFTAVRFGNVLGSSGSVLSIFEGQIRKGGPITVTHPDMKRFFMTVEEAVQLILQACAMAEGGETFILKMGQPVSILEMARNLVLLHGLEPGKDIAIEFSGIRPGEKLSEELTEPSERVLDSGHPSILKLDNGREDFAAVKARVNEFASLPESSAKRYLSLLREMVPSFTPEFLAAARQSSVAAPPSPAAPAS